MPCALPEHEDPFYFFMYVRDMSIGLVLGTCF